MAIRTCRCRRQLSRYVSASETWQRANRTQSRKEQISAAYGEYDRQSRDRYTAAPRTGHPCGAPEAQDRYRGQDRGGPGRQTLPAVQPDSS